MSTRICFMYRLREGVDRAAYERWVREVDVPFATARRTLLRYECVHIDGQIGSDSPSPYDYIELLEVTDVDDDQAGVTGPDAERIANEWLEFVRDHILAFGDPVASFSRIESS